MEADVLVTAHGDRAWEIAYARSRDLTLTDAEHDLALAVRREIERRTGIVRQPDTATRYLTSGG